MSKRLGGHAGAAASHGLPEVRDFLDLQYHLSTIVKGRRMALLKRVSGKLPTLITDRTQLNLVVVMLETVDEHQVVFAAMRQHLVKLVTSVDGLCYILRHAKNEIAFQPEQGDELMDQAFLELIKLLGSSLPTLIENSSQLCAVLKHCETSEEFEYVFACMCDAITVRSYDELLYEMCDSRKIGGELLRRFFMAASQQLPGLDINRYYLSLILRACQSDVQRREVLSRFSKDKLMQLLRDCSEGEFEGCGDDFLARFSAWDASRTYDGRMLGCYFQAMRQPGLATADVATPRKKAMRDRAADISFLVGRATTELRRRRGYRR